MNAKQKNKLAMYCAIRSLLTDAPETSAIAAFPPAFARLNDKIAAIETLRATQTEPLAVAIAYREAVVGEMIAAVLQIEGMASAYANQNNRRDLTLKFGVQASDFARIRLDERVHRAQSIVDAVRPLLPQLADYGVTPAGLDAAEAKIAAADAVATSAREAIITKSTATAELIEAFRDVDRVLETEMDGLLRQVQGSHREFYGRYRAARAVVDRPGGRGTIEAPPAPAVVSVTPVPEQKAA